MDRRVLRTADELVRLIRKQLGGHYQMVPIKVERSRDSWIAIAQVESRVTRERIEAAVRRVRLANQLAD